MPTLLSKSLQQYRDRIEEIVKDLHKMTQDIGNDELADTVSNLRNRIREPYMFVVVGEVKAGKSSFVNALLENGEICAVAPEPKTDTIQQIFYGEEREITQVNEYLKKIYVPAEILREIVIVDTPGTNTISEHHQEITERFVPASDLIVFVFEAKNPYRQSAWDFFKYIHSDWHKKVIFVLQQKDLMEADDLATNFRGVQEYARKQGIQDPKVYAVSAKREINGVEDSGFGELRAYIRDNITGGNAPILKLRNNVHTAQTISERIGEGLQTREAQLAADRTFREDVTDTLDRREQNTRKQVSQLVDNILAIYDRHTKHTEEELANGLGFFSMLRRSVASAFSSEASPKGWLKGLARELEHKLEKDLRAKLNEGVGEIAESIHDMAQVIQLKLQSSRTVLPQSHELFGEVAERRAVILAELQEAFSAFLASSESFTDESLFNKSESISPSVATGSGLAVVGVILATVTQGAVFDITGGIITGVGLLFAGGTVVIKRGQILREYRREIAQGRAKLKAEVEDRLNSYVHNIKERIDGHFHEFDSMMTLEREQLDRLTEQQAAVQAELTSMESHLQKKLKGVEA